MRFLVDMQLPAVLARWLRERGQQAEHVLEINLARSKDTPIYRYAQEHGAAIVTKDEDFAEWVRRVRPGPPVVWLRLRNSSKRLRLAWLEPLLTHRGLLLRGVRNRLCARRSGLLARRRLAAQTVPALGHRHRPPSPQTALRAPSQDF